MATDLMADLIAQNSEDFHSSSIETVGYDRLNRLLFVEFQSGPAVYAYEGVSESTYNLFVTSPSVGSFYVAHIQGNFVSAKHDYAYINEREPEDVMAEPVDIKPEIKFVSGDDFIDTLPAIEPSTFSVTYTVDNADYPHGPFTPVFTALSEADALVQFEAALSQMRLLTGLDLKTKIKSVTHYLD